MIGYFAKAGDPEVGAIFRPYLWAPWGLARRLEELEQNDYGKDLTLLLIQYYVEGRYPIFGPKHLKVKNYSTKNKDIAVALPVNRSDFHDVGDNERKQFLVDSTLAAITGVRARLGKRDLDIDFGRLEDDVSRITNAFLASVG